jgi:ferredoxin-NADP reductase
MTTPYTTVPEAASRRGVRARLARAARWLTTPLDPDDYLGSLNALWPAGEPRGRVEAVLPETPDAATLVIRPGRGWVPHRPGQWVRVGVDVDGVRHRRAYSLSSPPGHHGGLLTITVKEVPDGLVSRHLVRRTEPGTILHLSRPEGEFVLPDPLPPKLLFLTAGSGITPVMAMLRGLPTGRAGGAGGTPDVVLVHSAPAPENVIFGAELRSLAARVPGLRLYERHTRSEGRLRPTDLPGLCPDLLERDVWVCGPAAMLEEVTAYWTGPADRLRVERFLPAAPVADGAGGPVRFTRSGREADADGGTPLLVVGEEAGVLMPSGCRMGICRGCLVRLSSGRIRDLRTGRIHGEAGDLVQTCVSAAAGPVEIEL